MPGTTSSAARFEGVKSLQIVEIILLLACSVLIQFVIHLFPSSATPLGAILLPMFYTPLIALIFFRFHTALTVGLLSPVVNHLITGAPVEGLLALMTVEMVVFISLLYVFLKFKRTRKTGALPAVILTQLISPYVLLLTGVLTDINFFNAVYLAIPGMIILTLLNYFLIRYKEKY